jgi:hypothetical protein
MIWILLIIIIFLIIGFYARGRSIEFLENQLEELEGEKEKDFRDTLGKD